MRFVGFLHVDVGVASGRLGGGRNIGDVVEGLHGRPKERERRGQGQACVAHVVYGHRAETEASLAVSRAVALRAAASLTRALL